MRQLKACIREEILNDSGLTALIGENVYPGELATIETPQYPCINFSVSGGNPDPSTDNFQETYITFWVWSKDSFDFAWKIYEKLKVLFSRNIKNFDVYRFHFSEIREPLENFDPVGKLYNVNCDWTVKTVKL